MSNRGGKRENTGRKPGSVSAVTLAIRQLASEHSNDAMKELAAIMTDKDAPAAARVSAAKEVLERAHGKSVNVVTAQFDPPLSTLDPADALSAITDKVTNGELPPDEGLKLTSMVEAKLKATEIAELDERLKALEAKNA